MRPLRRSPAHHSAEFAELVCSNSFGALSSDRAAGLLQEELRRLGSVVINTADAHAVPAGGALAVDRSLGGLAEWLDWGAPKTSGLAIDGAAALRGATVPVTIHYGSSDPLG